MSAKAREQTDQFGRAGSVLLPPLVVSGSPRAGIGRLHQLLPRSWEMFGYRREMMDMLTANRAGPGTVARTTTAGESRSKGRDVRRCPTGGGQCSSRPVRAARLQSLDFLAQVAGEVRAVRRLEVTKGPHGCREMITPPLQVVEHFSAATFNLTIELLSATMCIGIETLCIDPGFGLDPRGTCTGVGGELMCGPVGLLSDPLGIRGGFLDQPFGLLGGQLDEADDGRAGFLPVVTTIVPDAEGCTGAGGRGTGG